jgi:hypothetical protein
VDSIDRVDFGCGEIRYDVDTVQELAREFFEIFDFADFVHLINDAIEDRFNVLVSLLLKERPLAFQPRLVAEKFFLIKGGNLPFSTFHH